MSKSLHYPCNKNYRVSSLNLYAKKKYDKKVKAEFYQYEIENKPFDNDIRNPKLNWFLPHYNQLGCEKETEWKTTTNEMLIQPFTHKRIEYSDKKLLSYFTYNDKYDDENKYSRRNSYSGLFTLNDYITTMQNSYKLCRGQKIDRFPMAETPFLRNRRFLIEDPNNSPNKFWDENYRQETAMLHKYKPNRQLCYNFMTGLQSDGTELPKHLYTLY